MKEQAKSSQLGQIIRGCWSAYFFAVVLIAALIVIIVIFAASVDLLGIPGDIAGLVQKGCQIGLIFLAFIFLVIGVFLLGAIVLVPTFIVMVVCWEYCSKRELLVSWWYPSLVVLILFQIIYSAWFQSFTGPSYLLLLAFLFVGVTSSLIFWVDAFGFKKRERMHKRFVKQVVRFE
jgi:hypothetical protein